MAFPDTVLQFKAELKLPSGWTDITPYVYGGERSQVVITRGQSAEATTADPATCALELDNRDGRFSARVPTGPYYGSIGRNTPLRIGVDRPGSPGTVLDYTGSTTADVTTPDVAALDITGDIDIRVDVAPRLGIWPRRASLASKYSTSGNQRSWLLWIETETGILGYRWSADGTAATTVLSTAPIDLSQPRLSIRVTHDVNNGASGNTVTFYTAPTLGGTYTQLGAPVVTAGTTSLFNSSAPLAVGNSTGSELSRFNGTVYGLELRNGIAGTAVANPDFTAQAEGATGFTDAAGRAWSIGAGAAIIAPAGLRFVGEVSEWPPTWDPTGTDVATPITASGVLRRMQQGTSPLKSTMRRALLADAANVVAYWPCEDGSDAEVIASALDGAPPMQIKGDPGFQGYDAFAASEAIPTLNDSQWTGSVPRYTATGRTQVRCLLSVPLDTATGANQSIIAWRMTGTASLWHLSYQASGGLKLEAFDDDGVSLGNSGVIAFGLLGKDVRLSVELTETGGNVGWTISTLEPGAFAGLTFGGTITSQTAGRVTSVIVDNGGGIQDLAVGHISVQSTITSLFDVALQLAAYAGERAGRRLLRLAGENGIYARVYGDPDDTVMMGPQRPDTLINLLQECAASDGGYLFEPRDVLGVALRTRASMYNQAARLALDYTAQHLADPLAVTDDDEATRNDITVTRDGGASARLQQLTGRLSVSDPPTGVGRYDDEVTISLYRDLHAPDQAGWRLHIGTTDELRYPTVSLDMARRQITGNPTLATAIVAADVGDRLTITHPPAWLPPDLISQIVIGYTETLGNKQRQIDVACVPESPYQVAVYGTDRYDTSASSLATGSASAKAEGAGSATVITVLDANAAPFGVGNLCVLHDVNGRRKEATVFTVQSKSSFAGFTNITFTPAAREATTGVFGGGGDTIRRVDETSLSVATTSGPLWTTAAGDLPFDIVVDGERMTATAISGASSPQTFTVTRAVNGVRAAHLAGAAVRLFKQAIRAL